MSKFYSPSTRGFYLSEIHGTAMPTDVVAITDARYTELLNGQTAGKQIAPGEGGAPILVDPPATPLAQLQAQAWAAIQVERDRRTQSGGFMVRGYWFHSDTFSRTQFLGMMLAGNNLPTGIQWKTMDGRFVAMTPELAQEVFMAASASDPLVFAAAERHKALMQSAQNPLAYDFRHDWPVCFSDLFPGQA